MSPPKTHGMSKSPEFRIWGLMKHRCSNPNCTAYDRYGGRGIKVCERWQKFENFYADMGPRPSPDHSLDREDTNGDYEPANCRWATTKEQQNNRRDGIFVLLKGERLPLAVAAEFAGVEYRTAYGRYKRGLRDDAIFVRQRPSRHRRSA